MPAPKFAIDYYNLSENALFRDVILSIRADESFHRDINHKLVSMTPKDNFDKVIHDFLESDDRIFKLSGNSHHDEGSQSASDNEFSTTTRKITHNL